MSDASSASETIVSKTEQNAVEKVEDSRESDKSSTKSNKSLPSKSTNKLKQSASFKGRTQANVNPPVKRSSFSRPKGRQIPSRPQAVDKAATVAVPKIQTPPKKIVPKKACSTPTNDDVTISDMTLDASCISVVNRTRLPSMPNLLDDTVPNVAPLLKMKAPPIKEGFDNTIVEMPTNTTTVRRHTMVPPRSNPGIGKMGAPRTSAKLKKPLISKGQGANKTICTDTTRSVTNDDDEITDEMMDAAYTRYFSD